MELLATGYPVALALTAFLAASLAIFALGRRSKPGATALAVLLLGQTIWSVCAAATVLTSGTPAALVWVRLTYVGVVLTVAGLVTFSLAFTDRANYLGPRTYAALAVEPVLFLALVALEPQAVWTFGGPSPAEMSGWALRSRPAFWIHTAYSYGLIALSFGLLIHHVARSTRIYRRQTYAVLVATVAPVVGNLVYVLGDVPVDLTPIAFGITAVALTWAVHSAEFLDISPVAHSAVVDSLTSAVFVLDAEDRIVEANESARDLFGPDVAVGDPAAVLLVDDPELARQISGAAGRTRFEVERDGRFFDVNVTPLFDSRDHVVGRVVLVHDLTRRRNRELELERTNRQLDRFASVVSHDLRNPLQVAAGNLELARETCGDEHFDRVESAHERMGSIVDGVLTLARDGETETERIALADVVEEAWGNVDTGDAALDVDADAAILANRPQLLQLFENLFRNSVEHGVDAGDAARAGADPGATSVTVAVGATADGFFVADDGPGIPSDLRERIFEHGFSGAEGGTGLGLAIVEHVASVNGWDVTVGGSETGGARFDVSGVSSMQRIEG